MNQSEKVCKQLGIPPRYLYKCIINRKDVHGLWSQTRIFNAFQLLMHFKDRKYNPSIIKTKVIKVEKIYPDMTEPGNFVKFAQVFPFLVGEQLKSWLFNQSKPFFEYIIERINDHLLSNDINGMGIQEHEAIKVQNTEWDY